MNYIQRALMYAVLGTALTGCSPKRVEPVRTQQQEERDDPARQRDIQTYCIPAPRSPHDQLYNMILSQGQLSKEHNEEHNRLYAHLTFTEKEVEKVDDEFDCAQVYARGAMSNTKSWSNPESPLLWKEVDVLVCNSVTQTFTGYRGYTNEVGIPVDTFLSPRVKWNKSNGRCSCSMDYKWGAHEKYLELTSQDHADLDRIAVSLLRAYQKK